MAVVDVSKQAYGLSSAVQSVDTSYADIAKYDIFQVAGLYKFISFLLCLY